MFTKATIIGFFASLAAAQLHAPVGQPAGNPITRPLNEVVPTCKVFTITWEPTTPNTVSVLLLKGPSSNVVKFGPALAEGIANSGSLAWTPAADLEATNGSPTGYGIQIIDDVTGQYQYSTQFGISAGPCAVSSSSSSAAATSATPASVASSSVAAGGYGYSAGQESSAPIATSTPKPAASSTYVTVAPYPTTVVTQSSSIICSTTVAGNGSVVMPSGSMTVPSSSNATTSRLPEVTANSASGLQAGLSFAGAVAALALMI